MVSGTACLVLSGATWVLEGPSPPAMRSALGQELDFGMAVVVWGCQLGFAKNLCCSMVYCPAAHPNCSSQCQLLSWQAARAARAKADRSGVLVARIVRCTAGGACQFQAGGTTRCPADTVTLYRIGCVLAEAVGTAQYHPAGPDSPLQAPLPAYRQRHSYPSPTVSPCLERTPPLSPHDHQ